MEVILKKTKITKSIIEQSSYGSYHLIGNNEKYKILGWCRLKKSRIILLYNEETNTILKLPFIKDTSSVTMTSKNIQRSDGNGCYIYPKCLVIEIYFCDTGNKVGYLEQTTESDEEMLAIQNKCMMFAYKVNKLGQIYI